MKIKTIQISGFRKILKATINMEDDITVIAGANNSGKTSIVELFNYVFNAKGGCAVMTFPYMNPKNGVRQYFLIFKLNLTKEMKKKI